MKPVKAIGIGMLVSFASNTASRIALAGKMASILYEPFSKHKGQSPRVKKRHSIKCGRRKRKGGRGEAGKTTADFLKSWYRIPQKVSKLRTCKVFPFHYLISYTFRLPYMSNILSDIALFISPLLAYFIAEDSFEFSISHVDYSQ